jgi:hypothetical protein
MSHRPRRGLTASAAASGSSESGSPVAALFLESSFICRSMQRRPVLARRPPQGPRAGPGRREKNQGNLKIMPVITLIAPWVLELH